MPHAKNYVTLYVVSCNMFLNPYYQIKPKTQIIIISIKIQML